MAPVPEFTFSAARKGHLRPVFDCPTVGFDSRFARARIGLKVKVSLPVLPYFEETSPEEPSEVKGTQTHIKTSV